MIFSEKLACAVRYFRVGTSFEECTESLPQSCEMFFCRLLKRKPLHLEMRRKLCELSIDCFSLKLGIVACWRDDVTFSFPCTCAKGRTLITSRGLCLSLNDCFCVFIIGTDFQLNSHLTTLASIHKIHHTLHRLVNTHRRRFSRVNSDCHLLNICFSASVVIEPDRRRWTG